MAAGAAGLVVGMFLALALSNRSPFVTLEDRGGVRLARA